MKNKKRILSLFLDRTRLLNLLGHVSEPALIIVNYHRIHSGELDTPFDQGVFGPSVEQFEKEMAFLRRHVRLVDEDEVVRMAQSGETLTERCALVTFDDGYKDNFTLAKPVLEKYRVPAVFFIPVNAIEQSRLGWWDIIAYFVKRTGKQSIPFKGRELPVASVYDEQAAIRVLLNHMKTTKHEESREFLSELSELCDVAFPSTEAQAAELMSWDEIRDIAHTEGLSIGSHTVSHRVLSTISDDEEQRELRDSRRFLQERLDCDIRSIAYPVGNHNAFSERTKRNARDAGYSVGFSFNTGINRERLADPFDVMRIGPEGDLSTYKASVLLSKIFVR